MTGTCRYCGQIVMVDGPEDMSEAERNNFAVEQCSCDGAKKERERERRIWAAYAYIDAAFEDEKARDLMKAAIQAITTEAVDGCQVQIGQRNYKIDIDTAGMPRIKRTYKEQSEETF